MTEMTGLKGEKVRLVPPDKHAHLENSLRWLNDPEVTHYLLMTIGVTRGMEEEWFDLDLERNALALLVEAARADRDDRAFLRLLLGGVGQDDAGDRHLLTLVRSHDDAVSERLDSGAAAGLARGLARCSGCGGQ